MLLQYSHPEPSEDLEWAEYPMNSLSISKNPNLIMSDPKMASLGHKHWVVVVIAVTSEELHLHILSAELQQSDATDCKLTGLFLDVSFIIF